MPELEPDDLEESRLKESRQYEEKALSVEQPLQCSECKVIIVVLLRVSSVEPERDVCKQVHNEESNEINHVAYDHKSLDFLSELVLR